jgi:hypothetical protein
MKQESDAAQGLIKARAAAEESKLVAVAKAAEAHAANQALTPLAVMMHGYDALKALGGTNAHIYLGDWSKMPNFLLPPSYQGQLGLRPADTKP